MGGLVALRGKDRGSIGHEFDRLSWRARQKQNVSRNRRRKRGRVSSTIIKRQRLSIIGIVGTATAAIFALAGLASSLLFDRYQLTLTNAAYALTLAGGTGAVVVERLPLATAAASKPLQQSEKPADKTKTEPDSHTSLPTLLGQITVQSILLEKPKIVLQAPILSERTDKAQLLAPMLEALNKLSFELLKVHDGIIELRDGGKVLTVLKQVSAEFEMGRSKGAASGRGSFVLRGREVSFELGLGVAPTAGQPASFPIRLQLASDIARGGFNGIMSLNGGFHTKGQLRLEASSLRDMLNWFGTSLKDGPGLNEAQLAGEFSFADGVMSLSDAAFRMDSNQARGFIAVNVKKPMPMIDATLDLSSLDLSEFHNESKSLAIQELADWAGELAGIVDLKSFDADLRLSADDIALDNVKTGPSAVTLSLRSGKLLADVAEIEMFGGSARGQLEVDTRASPFELSLRGDLDNVAIDQCLAMVFGISPLSGAATVAANLTAQGHTSEQIVQSLRGDIQLAMPNGGEFGVDLSGLANQALKENVEGWVGPAVRPTEFDGLKAKVILRDGTAISETIRMRTYDRTFSADGSANLVAESIYVRIDLNATQPNGSSAEKRATKPQSLVLRGPWSRPLIHIESLGEDAPEKNKTKLPGNNVRAHLGAVKSAQDANSN